MAVGQRIMKAAAENNLKRVTVEFGGKSPTCKLVLDDYDLEAAVKWATFGIMYVTNIYLFIVIGF